MSRLSPQGFLAAYREFTAAQESPDSFHLWVALSLLSGVMRRHVWVDQVYYVLSPNLYTVLVSPPGTCKKSLAINIGMRLLKQVPDVDVESNKMTPQSLLHRLSGGDFSVHKDPPAADPIIKNQPTKP